MGDMLSQAEIDALLNGTSLEEDSQNADMKEEAPAADTNNEPETPKTSLLTSEDKDALGEIGNICMGTSATTLYALLGQKVSITTPRVEETTWEEVSKKFNKPYIAVKVQYTEGLKGYNLLIIKEEDAKIITDLMMGGDGFGNIQTEFNELHLSAISEAMNQMVGSSSTSLSSIFEKRVDISPPEPSLIGVGEDTNKIRIDSNSNIVVILFSLKVGDLIDSEIMQILPISFAKEMAYNLLHQEEPTTPLAAPPPVHTQPSHTIQPHVEMPQQQEQPQPPPIPPQSPYGPYGYPPMPQYQMPPQRQEFHQPVNVQPMQFQSFDDGMAEAERKNIGLLMDVPLQIAVELGRTTKKIREILEFGQGSIIELDKLAGEPVDIMVNGKTIAKGEVVVIDESFGVRITDIIHPSKRL
ncbi:MAG: flagellar motor switch phosphatase FliY [Clostridiaceae bacterium]|jgi:flagellar motor switch protein FliN/FliY|nr:flagellar motor switch phosphatase FliY [Clostridiaceae bacterium]